MAKAYVFLADGFEDIEALGTIDILRRAGIEVKTVSITDSHTVESAHGMKVEADILFEKNNFSDGDMLVLPGGMPGAANLNAHDGLRSVLLLHDDNKMRIAAICAAPMILGKLGILQGRRATCYPGFEEHLDEATYTSELVTTDGHITTGEGPAATFAFAYELVRLLTGDNTADRLADGMMYTHLMESR